MVVIRSENDNQIETDLGRANELAVVRSLGNLRIDDLILKNVTCLYNYFYENLIEELETISKLDDSYEMSFKIQNIHIQIFCTTLRLCHEFFYNDNNSSLKCSYTNTCCNLDLFTLYNIMVSNVKEEYWLRNILEIKKTKKYKFIIFKDVVKMTIYHFMACTTITNSIRYEFIANFNLNYIYKYENIRNIDEVLCLRNHENNDAIFYDQNPKIIYEGEIMNEETLFIRIQLKCFKYLLFIYCLSICEMFSDENSRIYIRETLTYITTPWESFITPIFTNFLILTNFRNFTDEINKKKSKFNTEKIEVYIETIIIHNYIGYVGFIVGHVFTLEKKKAKMFTDVFVKIYSDWRKYVFEFILNEIKKFELSEEHNNRQVVIYIYKL